jgi:chaperonin cofactor prefoldin
LEAFVKKLIEIDKSADDKKMKNQLKLMEEVKNFQMDLRVKENEYKKEGKLLGNMEYHRLVEEGYNNKEKIEKRTKKDLDEIENRFNKIRRDIVNRYFKQIIKGD